MKAAAQATVKAEGARLRRKCEELIKHAERLKSELASAATPGDAIIRDASQLHGNSFPPWDAEPLETDFQTSPEASLFM